MAVLTLVRTGSKSPLVRTVSLKVAKVSLVPGRKTNYEGCKHESGLDKLSCGSMKKLSSVGRNKSQAL